MFYKSKRTVHSLPFLHRFKNIHIVNDFHEEGDVLLCPWLVGTEYGYPPDRDVKYVFGHFQLPLFLANASYEMPDRGGLHADHFYQCEAVFSGHFHKRQIKINKHSIPVTYTGNCFGHNFNDVNDRARGCMILEWNKEPVMLDWKDAPNYNRILLSNLLDIIDNDKFHDRYNTYSVIECKDDLNITLEETLEVKESLQEHVRSIKIITTEDDLGVEEETEVADEDFENLDDLVISHLLKLDTEGSEYERDTLVEIYKGSS